MLNQRKKKRRQYLVVWIPEMGWLPNTSNESTYLDVLKWIGGERISKVYLKVCGLPLVTKELFKYEQYSEYMVPIGRGWYVNLMSTLDDKYRQLCTMNDVLNLRMTTCLLNESQMSDSDKEQWSEDLHDIDRDTDNDTDRDIEHKRKKPKKIFDKLNVKFKGFKMIFDKSNHNRQLFAHLIELIGINDVCKLGLQAGRYELVTRMKLYDTQLPCGDFWVTVPNGIKYKYKILQTIKALLKIDMEVSLLNESQDSGSNDLHEIGHKKEHERKKTKNKEILLNESQDGASDREKWSNDLHKIDHEKEHERKKTKDEEISGTLYVKYKDLELLFNKGDRNRLLFVLIFELIGINDVYKLGLRTGGHELVTRMKLYDTQFHYGDFWITVPSETIYKYNILRTIKKLLKFDMKVSLVKN